MYMVLVRVHECGLSYASVINPAFSLRLHKIAAFGLGFRGIRAANNFLLAGPQPLELAALIAILFYRQKTTSRDYLKV